MAEAPATEIAAAYVSLIPTLKGVQGNIAQQFGAETPAIEAEGEKAGTSFIGGLKKTMVVTAVVGGVVAGFKQLYDVGETFDDVTDTIRAGTGAQGAALDSLVASAKAVGDQVPADFSEIGPTIADLNTRLGLSGQTLQTVASQYLEAGRVLGQDVDINKTSAAFSAFGIQGDAVSGAMDDLFRVAQSTGVSMNDLAGDVQRFAPALTNLGFSFQDSAALAGSLDKAGMNTSQTFAAMQKGMVGLAKSGEAPADAFRRVTGEISNYVSEGNQAAAIDLAGQVFGTRGAAQFVGAIQSGTLALDDLMSAAGTTSDTILGVGQETMDAAEKWQILKNNVKTALDPLGSAVFGLASAAMGQLEELAQKISPLVSSIASTLVSKFGGLGGSLTSGLSGMWDKIGPAISSLVPQVMQLFHAFSPLGLALDAIRPILPTLADAFEQIAAALGGALSAVLPTVTSLVSQIASVLSGAIVTILPTIVSLFSMLAGVVAQVAPPLAQVAQIVVSALSGAIGDLVPMIAQLVANLVTGLAPVLPVIGQLITQLAAAFSDIFTTAVTAIMPILTQLVSSVLSAIIPILPTVTSLVSMLAQIFMTLLSAVTPLLPPILQLVQVLMSALAPLLPTIAQLVATIAQVVVSLVSALSPLLPVITNLISVGLNVLVTILTPLIDLISWLANILMTGLNIALTAVMPVVSGVISILTSFAQFLTGVLAAAVQGIATVISSVWGGIQSVTASVWNGIQTAIMTPVNAVSGFVTSAFNSIRSGITSAMTGARDIISTTFGALAGIVKAPINAVISLINKAIGAVNSISVTIPDWVPVVGGDHFGLSIPRIPMLADGGIVKAQPGGHLVNVAEAGEDEAVIPLSQINELVAAPSNGKPQIVINVHPAPGMNEEQLAKMMGRELDRAAAR